MDDEDGVIRRDGDRYTLTFTRRLKHPVDKVWAALTVPERIADWLATATISPGPGLGADFALHFINLDYRMAGKIVAYEPPRLIAWTWPDGDLPDSVVRFELEPDGAGCLLTLTQDRQRLEHLHDVAAGWHTHLEGLSGAVDGVHTPWSAEREAVHARRYAAAAKAV